MDFDGIATSAPLGCNASLTNKQRRNFRSHYKPHDHDNGASIATRILGLGFGLAVVFGTMVGVGTLRLPGTVPAALGAGAARDIDCVRCMVRTYLHGGRKHQRLYHVTAGDSRRHLVGLCGGKRFAACLPLEMANAPQLGSLHVHSRCPFP